MWAKWATPSPSDVTTSCLNCGAQATINGLGQAQCGACGRVTAVSLPTHTLTWRDRAPSGALALHPRFSLGKRERIPANPPLMYELLQQGRTLRCDYCPCSVRDPGLDKGRAFKLVDGKIWHQRDQGEWIQTPANPVTYVKGWSGHEFEVE